jgi:hypothetical protein
MRLSQSSPNLAQMTVGVGALSAIGFAERAPTRLALLGTLPRKREREEGVTAP